jgi:hypothetical protein
MAFTIVQASTSFAQASASTVGKAFASNNTAGNLLVAFVNAKPTTSVTISDSAGNTWSSALAGHDVGGEGSALFYCLSAKGGANTVTIANGGTFVSLALIEYSNAGATFSFDTTAGNSNVSSAVPAQVSIALAQANELCTTMYVGGGGGSTLTPATGNTIEIGATTFNQAMDAQPSSSGAFVAGAASGQAGSWSVVAAGFIASFSGGSYYSQPDCRISYCGLVPTTNVYPNGSVNVYGTLTYTVETSNNPAVPSVDSRVAGAPVDSRANQPQNSRTPGTFGPGE